MKTCKGNFKFDLSKPLQRVNRSCNMAWSATTVQHETS